MQPSGVKRELSQTSYSMGWVVKCKSETVYRIQDSRAPRERIIVHFDRLKQCSKGMRTAADINGKKGAYSEVQQETKQLPPQSIN